jgi:hypothetical protein
MHDPATSSLEPSPQKPQGIPGPYVVLGMFAFGILITGLLFAYWHYHTAPFQKLQSAIAEEFPGSRPRVEGGQQKQHKETPRILRVIMKVDYHPESDLKTSNQTADRVLELAELYHDLAPYDLVEIHLYWPEKEQKIHEFLIERPLKSTGNQDSLPEDGLP